MEIANLHWGNLTKALNRNEFISDGLCQWVSPIRIKA